MPFSHIVCLDFLQLKIQYQHHLYHKSRTTWPININAISEFLKQFTPGCLHYRNFSIFKNHFEIAHVHAQF